jgi:hypothetical protein
MTKGPPAGVASVADGFGSSSKKVSGVVPAPGAAPRSRAGANPVFAAEAGRAELSPAGPGPAPGFP